MRDDIKREIAVPGIREQRYLALDNEIANARLRWPADDLRVANLGYRKLVIADAIGRLRLAARRIDPVD